MFLFAITIAVALALVTCQPIINASEEYITEDLSLQNTWIKDTGVSQKFEATHRKKRSASNCQWIAVAEKEGDKPFQYLLNSNGTLTLSALALLHEDFPGVTSLRYLNKANNRLRVVQCDKETCNPGPNPCSQTYLVTRKLPVTINVVEKDGEEPLAFRINDDGRSISLKTISSHFPGTIGLKYQDPVSKILTFLACENMICHLHYSDLPKISSTRTYIAIKRNEGIKAKAEGSKATSEGGKVAAELIGWKLSLLKAKASWNPFSG